MNRKMKILGILASAALAALVGTGLYLRFGLQVLDRPGMENPAAPMLELLSAEWTSEDGVWSAHIDDYKLYLSYRQELVYSGSFSFDFQVDDLNVKTELNFYDKQFESEAGSVSSTMESLYMENRRLHLDITVSKEEEGSVRQQAVLNRVEYGKPAESESGEIREVSEMAELVEFSWDQITIGDIIKLPFLKQRNRVVGGNGMLLNPDRLAGQIFHVALHLIQQRLIQPEISAGKNKQRMAQGVFHRNTRNVFFPHNVIKGFQHQKDSAPLVSLHSGLVLNGQHF